MLLAFGANLGTRAGSPLRTIEASAKCLADAGLILRRLSRPFATPAHPPGSGPEFVNAAALVSSGFPPNEVLERLHGIEAEFGRCRSTGGRWQPRPLDIDLIADGDAVLPDGATQAMWRRLAPERQRQDVPGDLILPHPRVQDRAFVLVPLMDVAPGWRHPLLGETVAEMLARLPAGDSAAIRPLDW